MNLNNDKNLALARKGVYANQLFHYSKLCQAYQDLADWITKEAEELHKDISSLQIEQRYEEPLAKIVASENIKETLHKLAVEYLSDDPFEIAYSTEEMNFFKNFATSSEIFKTFQTASKLLDEASVVSGSNRKKTIDDFHKYMQHPDRPKTVQNFDKLITLDSPRYLGCRFFLMANKGIRNIDLVDSSHIPLDLSIIRKKMNPKEFGAIITGHKTLERKIENLENEQPDTEHFDINNWNLAHNLNNKVKEARHEHDSTNHSFKEKLYVAGTVTKNATTRFYTAHKKVLNKAATIATSIAIALGVGNQIRKEIIANNLDIDSSTQYEQTISDETKEYMYEIMQKLVLQKHSIDPQYADAKNIENNIDLILDYIVKDQVTTAFENYHNGYKVTDVESKFDQKYKESPINDYCFIEITYIDDKGIEGKETIQNFKSEFLTKKPLEEIFDLEEKIDLNSPVFEAFKIDETKDFLSRAKDIDDVFGYLEDAIKKIRNFSAYSIEHDHSIWGEPYLKSTLPEKKDNNDNSSKNPIDEERE